MDSKKMNRKDMLYAEYNNCPNLADEDIVININVHNDSETQPIAAKFAERSNIEILSNQKDYKMSIIRLDIPLSYLNIMSWDNLNPAPSITLSYPNASYDSLQIINLIQVDYAAGFSFTNANNVYYFQQVISSINNALTAAFNDIVASIGPLPAGAPTEAPYFVYDPTTKLISLITQVEYDDTNPLRIEVWYNRSLSDLIESLYADYYGAGLPNGKDDRVVITNTKNNGYNPITGIFGGSPGSYYGLRQEFETSGSWYQLYKIALVTSGMNVRKENVFTQLSDGKLTNLSIVTDFSYDFETSSLSSIRYVPTGEFRWNDLLTDLPLTQLDFQIFIELKNGTFVPFLIGPQQNMNIKVLFRKK